VILPVLQLLTCKMGCLEARAFDKQRWTYFVQQSCSVDLVIHGPIQKKKKKSGFEKRPKGRSRRNCVEYLLTCHLQGWKESGCRLDVNIANVSKVVGAYLEPRGLKFSGLVPLKLSK